MKVIFSIILASALVLSVTANANTDSALFGTMHGFIKGLNHADLTPAIENCTATFKTYEQDFEDLISNIDQFDSDNYEEYFRTFFADTVHLFRVCSKIFTNLNSLGQVLNEEIRKMNTTELGNRLLVNMFNFNMKYTQIKTAYSQGDFNTAGAAIAEILKMIIYGNANGPSRAIRQLSIHSYIHNSSLNFNATYDVILGFLESANTTINVNSYITLSAVISRTIEMLDIIAEALQNKNYPTAIQTFQKLPSAYLAFMHPFEAIQTQTAQFIERDLPLFNSQEKIEKVQKYLWANFATTTVFNFQKIYDSKKSGDYKELGHGLGSLFNEAREGAMNAQIRLMKN